MIYILYTLLALLALDVLSTVIALSKPGNGLTEGNGIMARAFARFGVVPVLMFTHLGFGGYAWYVTLHLDLLPPQMQTVWPVVLTLMSVFYGRTDFNNFKLIKGAA